MPPFGNAMRFVNGEQADLQSAKKVLKTERGESFRRDVQKLQLPAPRPLHHVTYLGG